MNALINSANTANRVDKHGKIDAFPFTLGDNQPFSIFK